MKRFAYILIIVFLSGTIYSQDECNVFLPEEGATLTYRNYNKKGKLSSTTTTEVLSVKEKEDGTHYRVRQFISDGKEKNDIDNTLEYRCDGNKFYVDMQTILIPEQMNSIEGGTVVVETEDMFFPLDLEPGMELNDGHIKMDASVEYMTVSINVRSFYRKVEAFEEIEVAAGKFMAWKISGNIESKFGFMRVAFKTVEWYVKDIGIVRSESYDNKKKLLGYTELLNIQ